MDFSGKNALVTGARQGIGAAIARKLASLGANVAIVDIEIDTRAKAIVQEIESMGRRALALEADVGSFTSAESVVEKAIDAFGGLHILVCNAGINRDAVSWKMSEDQWDSVIQVNLKGCFNYARAVIPTFRKQGYGKIVNVTSINGIRGKFGQANYAASKGGIIALTKTLARELGNKNINVNAVAPGLTETDMVAGLNDEAKEASKKDILLGRLGQPEDIANAVAFFASDLSRHVTGQVLNVDGGQLIA